MAKLLQGSTINGNPIWHSGNDGVGSGLDADKLKGVNWTVNSVAPTSPAKDDVWVSTANFQINVWSGTAWTALTDNAVATTTKNGLMAFADKVKLDGMSTGSNRTLNHANNGSISVDGVEQVVYSHPATHPASVIVQDASNRFMTDVERTKLNGIATGANNYVHPTGDGNLHVPATSTTNNGKVLKAGTTAGSLSWGTLGFGDMADVNITSPTSNQTLNYNGTSWVNSATPNAKAFINEGFRTSKSTAVNQWTKIASVSLTATGQTATSRIIFMGGEDSGATGTAPIGNIALRISQTGAMATAPVIGLRLMENQNFTINDIQTVTITNTASSTVVDLYINLKDINEIYTFVPSIVNGFTRMTFFDNQSLVTTLPTGTKTIAIYDTVEALALPPATTTTQGAVILSTSTNDTSTTKVATASAVKSAYDLANGKASTAVVTTTANGLMALADKAKLDGMATGANNYTHPTTHPPSIIVQDASNRFVTDTEKATWNAKAPTTAVTTTVNGLMAFADKLKLDGVTTGATNTTNHATNGAITVNGVLQTVYTHPTGAGNNHIPTAGATGNFLKYSASGTAVWTTPTSADITDSATKRFVTDTNIADWNGRETTTGSQTKATKALTDSKTYTDGKLVSGTPVSLTVNRGSQVVNVVEDTPVNVVSFEGRTVINYVPLFDSGTWVDTSGGNTGVTLVSPNEIYMTANGTTKVYTYKFSVVAGKTYTLSGIVPSLNGVYIDAVGYNSSNAPLIDISGVSRIASKETFTTPTGTTTLDIRCIVDSTVANGTVVNFKDVMLNEGATAQEFVANVRGVTNPMIENRTTGEKITVIGTYHTGDIIDVANKKVTKTKQEMLLDGNLNYEFLGSGNGFKQLAISVSNAIMSPTFTNVSGELVKYNGQLLGKNDSAIYPDSFFFNGTDKKMRFSVPNNDSGWGLNYTPTQAEIRAYFDGWYMSNVSAGWGTNYNGTGIKGWARRANSFNGVYSAGTLKDGMTTDVNPPIHKYASDSKWQPYKIVYNLIEPATKSIVVIGSLRLTSGNNTIELTEGKIVKEYITPVVDDLFSNINNGSTGWEKCLTKYRVDEFIAVYRNGEIDRSWFFYANTVTHAGALAQIRLADFDPKAIYEVSYIPLESYKVSSYATPVGVSYRDMLGGVTDELVKGVADISSRLSLQLGVIDAINNAKKKQEDWRYIVLQNGWSGMIAYRRNDFDQLEIILQVTSGTSTGGVVIGNLPTNYRVAPGRASRLEVLFANNLGMPSGTLSIDSAGNIKVAENSMFAVGNMLVGTTVIPL